MIKSEKIYDDTKRQSVTDIDVNSIKRINHNKLKGNNFDFTDITKKSSGYSVSFYLN